MKVTNFQVLDAMAAANKDIRLAPLGNIVNLRKVKAGTQVTIGVEGDLVAAIGIHGRFVGGLILADKAEFDATKAELERAQEPCATTGNWCHTHDRSAIVCRRQRAEGAPPEEPPA